MLETVNTLLAHYPWLTSVLLVIGVLRVILKPLFSLIHLGLQAGGLQTADQDVKAMETSKTVSVIVYVLDWLASVKLIK